jgi:hypothetical protein
MAVTREFLRKFLSVTALVEKVRKSALQLLQLVAVSEDVALHREQVCTDNLQEY